MANELEKFNGKVEKIDSSGDKFTNDNQDVVSLRLELSETKKKLTMSFEEYGKICFWGEAYEGEFVKEEIAGEIQYYCDYIQELKRTIQHLNISDNVVYCSNCGKKIEK